MIIELRFESFRFCSVVNLCLILNIPVFSILRACAADAYCTALNHQQAIETLRDSLFDLQHVNDLETSSVINHREIMTALPPLRAAHAKEESAKAKKKADRNHKRGQNSESSSSGTPGKGGLFGWFSGSGGKDLIGN